MTARFIDHYFAITVSDRSSSANEGNIQIPTRYFSYPQLNDDSSYLNNIVPFCFPSFGNGKDGDQTIDGWKDPWYHDFVLTDEQGQRRYATCLKSRLFQIKGCSAISANPSNPAAVEIKINDQPVPCSEISCLCLISNQPKFNTIRALLEELFICIVNGQQRPEPLLWAMLHQIIIPPTGNLSISVNLPTTLRKIVLSNRPANKQIPSLDFSLLFLFETLSISHVVDLFSMLLLEKSVLLHSRSPTIGTRCCEALLALLYPLQWDMVYVPLVPEALKGLTEAPTPFLMAGDSCWVSGLQVVVDFGSLAENLLQQSAVNGGGETGDDAEEEHKPGTFIKLDIDLDDLIDTHPERNYLRKRLPGRSAMINKIKSLIKRDMSVMNGGFRDLEEFECRLHRPKANSAGSAVADIDLAIRRVFLDWFLQTFSSLHEYYRPDGRFDDRKWLAKFHERDQDYYAAFVKTAMFRNFVDTRAPDVNSKRPDEYFDLLLSESVDVQKSNAQPNIVEMDLICDYNVSAEAESASATFDLDLFQRNAAAKNHGFQPTIDQLTTLLSKNQNCAELFIMRGYCHEKSARRHHENGLTHNESNVSALKSALSDYLEAIRSDYQQSEYLGKRFRHVYGRLPKEVGENWLANCATDSDFLHSILKPKQHRQKHSKSPDAYRSNNNDNDKFLSEESARQQRRPSHDTTDHLVLNCVVFPSRSAGNSRTHIDSAETLDMHDDDFGMTEADLPPAIRELSEKPVELSIRLADTISSMFRIISEPPTGFETLFRKTGNSLARSKTNFSSMSNLKGRSPVFDLLSGGDINSTDTATRPQNCATGRPEHDFVMTNANKLKAIKTMPTFETFKRTLMALRWVRLEETIRTEEERLCFWLNIRNTMLLHIFVEFGVPMNLQHRIMFIYHKPVYRIAGHSFSVNEITYGILKPSLPIPSMFTGSAKSIHTTSGTSNATSTIKSAGLSAVHVTTSSSAAATSSIQRENTNGQASNIAPTLLHHETIDSTQHHTAIQPSTVHQISTLGPAKIPLKFIATDSRSKFKLTHPRPLVDFALIDGTWSGPRMRVYQPRDIEDQLEAETEWFLNHHVEFGKNAQVNPGEAAADEGSTSFASILGVGSKKRRVNFPQYILWHFKDFVVDGTSNEQLLAYFAFRFPRCEFSKFIQSERLLQVPSAVEKSIQTKNLQLNTAIMTKVQQTVVDQRLLLKIKNHNWNYLVRTCSSLD